MGDWGYINTECVFHIPAFPIHPNCNTAPSGLGLYEYLIFCEDLGMEAIMAVWSGEILVLTPTITEK